MRNAFRWFIVLAAPIYIAGCGESVLSEPLGLSPASLGALPSFPNTAVMAAGDEITDGEVLGRFRLECHMPGQANHCPDGVDAVMETKYSLDTLLGLIYHAEMFAMEPLHGRGSATCEWGDDAKELAATAGSFITDDAGGDTARYMIDDFARIACVGRQDASYYAYSNDVSGGYVVVTARKLDDSTAGMVQTDVSQIHVLTDADNAPKWLAFNSVNITTSGPDYFGASRAVLLVDYQTRRFLLRAGTNMAAAGRGGLTPAGLYEDGYYLVRSSEHPDGICIDNATRLEADAADCAAEVEPWASSDEVASYLGLDAAAQAELAPYLSYFAAGATAELLSADQVPSSPDDLAHFPDRIR